MLLCSISRTIGQRDSGKLVEITAAVPEAACTIQVMALRRLRHRGERKRRSGVYGRMLHG